MGRARVLRSQVNGTGMRLGRGNGKISAFPKKPKVWGAGTFQPRVIVRDHPRWSSKQAFRSING